MPLVIGELLVRLEASTEGLQKIQKGMEEVANKAQRAGQTLSIGLTVPLAAIGTAAIKLGMDAVEGENLFTVSMGRMAESARKWSQDLRKELGLNEYQLRQQVGTFNVMFQAMGIGETAAYDMSKGLTQLAYDMSSFFNMQPEAAFEKLTAAISGQVQPLRQLGIVINETTIEQYALNHGMIKQGEQLSEQGKILARYGAIMEQTAVAQGDMARTLDSPANKLRILQEQIRQTSTEFGIALLPAFHKAMEAAKPLVDKLKDAVDWFANLNPVMQENIVKWLALAAAIGPVTLAISQLIKVGGVITGVVGGILPVVNNAIFAFAAWQAGAATLSEALGLAAGKMSFLFGPAGIVLAGISAIALWVKHTNDTIEAERRLQTQHESTAATLRDLRDRYSEISGLMDKLKPGTDEYKRLEGELQAVMTQLNEILPDVTTATDNLAEARKRNLSAIDDEIAKERALAAALERTALQRDQARKQREIEHYSAEASRWRAQGETSLAEHLEKQRAKAETELAALNQRLALVAEAIRTGDYSKLIATLPAAKAAGGAGSAGAIPGVPTGTGAAATKATGKTPEEIWREIIDGLRQAQREMAAGIYPEMRMALARGEKWDWKAETAALIEDTIRALYSAGMTPEHNSMQWLVREYSGLVGGTSAGEDLLSRLGILSAGRRDRPVADWGLAMTSTERQVREAVQQVRDSIVGEAIQEVADIAERRRTTSGGLETIMAWGMTAGERQARDAVRQVQDALFAEAIQGVVDSAEARRARSGGVDTVLAWGMTASERQVREGVRQVADSIYTEAVQAVVDAAETRRARSGGVEMVLAWGMTTGERQVREGVRQVADAIFTEAIQRVVEAAESRRARSGGVDTVLSWGMTLSERQTRDAVQQVRDALFAEAIQAVVDAVEMRRARSGGMETVTAWKQTLPERQVREGVQQVRDALFAEAIQQVVEAVEARRSRSGGVETVLSWSMMLNERQVRDAVQQVRDALFAEAIQQVVDAAEMRRSRSGGVETVLAWGLTTEERQVREGVRQVRDALFAEAIQQVVEAVEARRSRSGGVETVLAWGMTLSERQTRDAVQQVADAIFAEGIQSVVNAVEARRARSGGVETVLAWGMTAGERQTREAVQQVRDALFAEAIQQVVEAAEARRSRSGGVETVMAWGMTLGERQVREGVAQVADAIFAEGIQAVVNAVEARRARSGGVETVLAWGMTAGERQVREGVRQVAESIYAEGIQAVVDAVETRRIRSGGVETVLAWGMTTGERQVREGVRQVADAVFAEGIQTVVDAVEARRARSGGVETVMAWGMTTSERQVREGVRQIADAIFAEALQAVVDAVEMRRARSGGVETVTAWKQTLPERQVREGVQQVREAIFAEAIQQVVDAVEKRRSRSGGVETVDAWGLTDAERSVRESARQTWEFINETLWDKIKRTWEETLKDEVMARMPILDRAVTAAQDAAAGGPQAMAIAVLASLLVDSTQFAALLERINPLLQAAADVVGAFLEPLMPIVTVLSAALTPALSVLAQVTGAILLPVMQALFPVFKGLGLVALGVTIAFGHAWNLLASIINKALGWLGVNLKLIDTGELGEAFQALAAMTWDQAAAAEAATNAMYNIPHGFKIAMRRFEAATAEPWTPGGTDAAGASRSMGSGESRGLTAAGGGVTVIVKGDVYGYEDFKRKVREAQMTGERSVRLAQYGTVGV